MPQSKRGKDKRGKDSIINNKASFTQWSANNVDHYIITFVGKNTIRGMGVVLSVDSKKGQNSSRRMKLELKY